MRRVAAVFDFSSSNIITSSQDISCSFRPPIILSDVVICGVRRVTKERRSRAIQRDIQRPSELYSRVAVASAKDR